LIPDTNNNTIIMTTDTSLPTLRYTIGSTVTPGDRLGTIRQVLPGTGTYVKGGQIYASVVGELQVERKEAESTEGIAKVDVKLVATVQPSNGKEFASNQVLAVGQVVLCRVVRIATQQAQVDILAREGVVGMLKNSHEGAIRREDVRTGANEMVQMQASFLPGDMVLCRVLSLGDSRRYYLTTAEPALGVIHAVSATSGQPMVPNSWKEMECPETGAKELRKCARPRDLSSSANVESETASLQ
jgi:exosome complex component CSL4